MFKKIKHMIPVQGMRQGQEKGHLHPSGDQRELPAGGHLNRKGQGSYNKERMKDILEQHVYKSMKYLTLFSNYRYWYCWIEVWG